jgi:hypothetical protein
MLKKCCALVAGVFLICVLGCGSILGVTDTGVDPELSEQTVQIRWYVAGEGAPSMGDDSNPGTAARPLASVQKALELIGDAYSSGDWLGEGLEASAFIVVSGIVRDYGTREQSETPRTLPSEGEETSLYGMVEIAGRERYPPIIIEGDSGDSCVLDAGEKSRVLYITDGNFVTITGVTLRGGNSWTGGGIYADEAVVVLAENAVLTENYASVDGGGVYIENGTLIIQGAELSKNRAGDDGGGIYAVYSKIYTQQCAIINNTADCGGGICIDTESTLWVFNGSSVSGNRVSGMEGTGGGLCAGIGSHIIMASGLVTNNEAELGGGVYVRDGALSLSGGEITGNTALNGAGVYLLRSEFNRQGGELRDNFIDDLKQY